MRSCLNIFATDGSSLATLFVGCSKIVGYPQHFVKDSLTVSRYPFILLGGERGMGRGKCLVQEHNKEILAGFEL